MISGVAVAESTTTLRSGCSLAERLEAAAPVGRPHTEFEGDDFRSAPLDQREQLGARVRHADDLDVLDALERAPEAFEHQPVVVGDQDLHADPSVFLRTPASLPVRAQLSAIETIRAMVKAGLVFRH